MRRLVFVALALLAAGGAAWLRSQGRASSFGPYTGAQLEELEAAYRAEMQSRPATGAHALAEREAAANAEVSLGLLDAERHRRLALLGALVVTVVAILGALLPRRGRPSTPRDEERRLAGAMGDPALILEGERHKAARLLGVALDAPPAVVDAALSAQLATHDLARLDGLAPDLRRMVLEQREALQRARDLLVTGSARRALPATRQQ